MLTNELVGAALDWAVAKCEGIDDKFWDDDRLCFLNEWDEDIEPSINWAQGGKIIERERISIEWTGEDWMSYIKHDEEFFGATPLVAAMRCYVASKLGDEVQLPEGLQNAN